MAVSRDGSGYAPVAPWTNVYGLARSVLASGTFLTLLLHDADTLFRPLGILIESQLSDGLLLQWSLFSLAGPTHLEFARWGCLAALVLVIIGWHPRWTALPHWWITWSLAGSSVLIDGGEQVATVLTLLMLPLALTDSRRWHWSGYLPAPGGLTAGWHARQVLAMWSVYLLRFQVAVIYFEAMVTKVGVPEWKNGTALFYWFNDPGFGMPEWLTPLLQPLLTHSVAVSAATWGVIIFEATLFLGLVMDKRWRSILLPAGLLFHLAIVFVHGLAIFFCSMAAALILYLRPVEDELRWPVRLGAGARDAMRAILARFEWTILGRASHERLSRADLRVDEQDI